MKSEVNDITITETSNGGHSGQCRGLIYLNNRVRGTLRGNKQDYIVSLQTFDRVISTAILSENQIIELIKKLELLLVDKADNRENEF